MMLLFWNFGSILQTDLVGGGADHLDAADVGVLSAADAVDLQAVPLEESLVGADRDFDQAGPRGGRDQARRPSAGRSE